MAKTKAKSLYSVHPGIVMVQSWVASLSKKTGRTLEEWISLVENEGPATEKDRIAIASPAEIDSEVKHWLRFAYDLDA